MENNNTQNEKTNGNNKQREEELGALWEKKSKDGSVYLSGYVTDKSGERIQLVLFVNKYKKVGEQSPDWRIYESKPLAAKQASSITERAKSQASANGSSTQVAVVAEEVSDNSEEIPF